MSPIVLTSGSARYEVQNLVGGTDTYNVYVCNATDGQFLLKVATETGYNGLLDREAFFLRDIQAEIVRFDAAYKARNHTTEGLGFKRCVPHLIDSFIANDQGGRRVNIVSVYGAEKVFELVPLARLREKERVRIDAKTSAWIMGRLLKIFSFTHPYGIGNGNVNGSNIVINPEKHHVVLLDWTIAHHYGGPVPYDDARAETSAAAKAVLAALGADEYGALPHSDQLPDRRYEEFLVRLAQVGVTDVQKAGQEFYELLGQLWPGGFHPFTTHPLKQHM